MYGYRTLPSKFKKSGIRSLDVVDFMTLFKTNNMDIICDAFDAV